MRASQGPRMSVRVSLHACAYYIIIYVTRLNLFVIVTFPHGNKSKAPSVSCVVLSAGVCVCSCARVWRKEETHTDVLRWAGWPDRSKTRHSRAASESWLRLPGRKNEKDKLKKKGKAPCCSTLAELEKLCPRHCTASVRLMVMLFTVLCFFAKLFNWLLCPVVVPSASSLCQDRCFCFLFSFFKYCLC